MVVITRAASNTARSTLFAQTFHRRVYRAGESDICLVHYFDDAHLISEKSRLAHAAPVPSPAPPPPRTSASGLVEGTSSSMLLDDEEGHVADDDLRLVAMSDGLAWHSAHLGNTTHTRTHTRTSSAMCDGFAWHSAHLGNTTHTRTPSAMCDCFAWHSAHLGESKSSSVVVLACASSRMRQLSITPPSSWCGGRARRVLVLVECARDLVTRHPSEFCAW